MTTPLTPAMEALAFRWPSKVEGCTCAICLRKGAINADTESYASPFAQYRLVRVDGYTERDPTDDERASFNAQYPQLAFSRTADQPGGKLATPWIKACLKLIRQIQKLKVAGAFLRPVDPVALNIPDYLTHIKHPMDLATVEAKLLATEARSTSASLGDASSRVADGTTYAAPDEFASDMRLIFRNAFLYNKPDNPVTAYAKELSIKFEQGWLQL